MFFWFIILSMSSFFLWMFSSFTCFTYFSSLFFCSNHEVSRESVLWKNCCLSLFLPLSFRLWRLLFLLPHQSFLDSITRGLKSRIDSITIGGKSRRIDLQLYENVTPVLKWRGILLPCYVIVTSVTPLWRTLSLTLMTEKNKLVLSKNTVTFRLSLSSPSFPVSIQKRGKSN